MITAIIISLSKRAGPHRSAGLIGQTRAKEQTITVLTGGASPKPMMATVGLQEFVNYPRPLGRGLI